MTSPLLSDLPSRTPALLQSPHLTPTLLHTGTGQIWKWEVITKTAVLTFCEMHDLDSCLVLCCWCHTLLYQASVSRGHNSSLFLFYSYDLKVYFAEIFMLVCILNVCTNANTSVIACVIARKMIGLI